MNRKAQPMKHTGHSLHKLGLLLALWAAPVAAQQESPQSVDASPAKPAQGSARQSAPDPTRPALHHRQWRYLLKPGDVLQLSFPLTPDFDQVVTIQPDGFVTLRLLGDVLVGGRTLPQLTEQLSSAYGRFLRQPLITIDLKEFEKPFFVVGGEVGHPGKYDLRSDTTVIQAVSIAGGFRESAKHSQVLLIRRVSEGWAEVKSLNVKKMLRARNVSEDLFLRPGDTVYVPKNTLSKVKPFIPVPGVGLTLGHGFF